MAGEQKQMMNYSGSEALLPKEEMLLMERRNRELSIGMPRETAFQESRVPLAPQAVGVLVANGHKVRVESGAGKTAHFSDHEYSEAGAEIVFNTPDIFRSDIVVKVAPLSDQELQMVNQRQTIISTLQLTTQNKEYFRRLAEKKVTAVAFEYIKDNSGSFPVVRAISEIVGTASIFIAAEYLADTSIGKGSLFGGFPGITPTEVVILGAGTVAQYAIRAALGLGAQVKVFDNSVYRLRRLQNELGVPLFTSIIQPLVLEKALKTADVAIGAIHSQETISPCLVSAEQVRKMKYGAVIIDISIDQGGCFETSRVTDHKNPVFKEYDITHYCVPNIASRYPHTASFAFSNFLTPVLLRIGEEGGVEQVLSVDYGVRYGVFLYQGILTKPFIGNHFGLPYQDIELLMAAIR